MHRWGPSCKARTRWLNPSLNPPQASTSETFSPIERRTPSRIPPAMFGASENEPIRLTSRERRMSNPVDRQEQGAAGRQSFGGSETAAHGRLHPERFAATAKASVLVVSEQTGLLEEIELLLGDE